MAVFRLYILMMSAIFAGWFPQTSGRYEVMSWKMSSIVQYAQNPKIDSLITEYTDVRKRFLHAHSEKDIDSINRVIQTMESISWIEKLAGSEAATAILMEMKQKASEETLKYKKDIREQKKRFKEMNPLLYSESDDNKIKWLKINEHQTLGIGLKNISELMIKEIGDIKWEPGILDMMGYMY